MPDVYKQITFNSIMTTILAVILLIVFLWAIYSFIRVIGIFVFSHWDKEKVKKAYTSIRFMILWVLLSLLLIFVFPLVFKRLHVKDAEDYNVKNIFNRMWEIIKTVWWMGTYIKNFQSDMWIWTKQTSPSSSQYSL